MDFLHKRTLECGKGKRMGANLLIILENGIYLFYKYGLKACPGFSVNYNW